MQFFAVLPKISRRMLLKVPFVFRKMILEDKTKK